MLYRQSNNLTVFLLRLLSMCEKDDFWLSLSLELLNILKQHHNSSPEDASLSPLPVKRRRALSGILLTLLILVVVLAYGTERIARAWPSRNGTPSNTSGSTIFSRPPIQLANGSAPHILQLPSGHTVVYETTTHIYLATTEGQMAGGQTAEGRSEQLSTPGFTYNRALPPLVTVDKKLIYSGATGIWLTDLTQPGKQPQQLASLPAGQVLTSLKVSDDGSALVYSTAPANGSGMLNIYAGPLLHMQRIYQAVAGRLPNFRAFSFLNGSDTTILLSDDHGDHRSAWYGLWSLDIAANSTGSAQSQQPRALLLDTAQQGPLALTAQGNTLLYSSSLGYVPPPLLNAPADISSLTYANALTVATIDTSKQRLVNAKELIQPQGDLANYALYNWIAQPSFSPDGQNLAYVEFSVLPSVNTPRYSALYTLPTSGGGSQLQATVVAIYSEMGGWLDNHTLLFYADGSLYAFDMQQQTLALLAAPGGYARIIATLS